MQDSILEQADVADEGGNYMGAGQAVGKPI